MGATQWGDLLRRFGVLLREIEVCIDQGISSRQVRPCHPAIAARVVLGLLLWAPSAMEEFGPAKRSTRGRLQSALIDLLCCGWTADRRAATGPNEERTGAAGHRAADCSHKDVELSLASAIFNRACHGVDEAARAKLRAYASVVSGDPSDLGELARLCHLRTLNLLFDAHGAALAGAQGPAALASLRAIVEDYMDEQLGLISPLATRLWLRSADGEAARKGWIDLCDLQHALHAGGRAAGELRGRYDDLAPVFQLALCGFLASDLTWVRAPSSQLTSEIVQLLWYGLERE
jgi:hypothetical protein